MRNPLQSQLDLFTARVFTVAWYWFLLAAIIAIFLRWLPISNVSGWNINHIRHAHSHVAFLGWVFNAFFAVALQLFVPEVRRKAFFYLFIVLQIAVAGMAASFPLQGYAAVSITFSTLHMMASAIFAWWLWSSPRIRTGTRVWLRMALAFMLLSGLGPIILGPLAAMDLRDHPAYTLAIYFYLHCQYNGWFILFPIAAVWQRWELMGGSLSSLSRWSAILGLGCGTLAGFALSTLWLDPHWSVWLIAGLSGIAQVWGAWHLRPTLIHGWGRMDKTGKFVLSFVVSCYIAKLILQILACFPSLAPLAHHRFIAIAFLHLIFLGIVTPFLIYWAWHAGWIRRGFTTRSGALVFLTGCFLTELMLVISAFSGRFGMGLAHMPQLLLASAAVIGVGLILIRPTVV